MTRGVEKMPIGIGVDGVQPEIAPPSVLVPVGGEGDHGPPSVRRHVPAQGGDFDRLMIGDGGDGPVLHAGRRGSEAGGLKSFDHIARRQGRGHVDIVDRPADQGIADAAADEAGAAATTLGLERLDDRAHGGGGHPRLRAERVTYCRLNIQALHSHVCSGVPEWAV